jgi:HupE / UreJ protein
MLKKITFLFFIFPLFALAHPMPNSILNLDIGEKTIQAEVQLPLSELQSAMNIDLGQNPENQLDNYKNAIQTYFFNHIKIKDWTIVVGDIAITDANQEASGDYKELNLKITLMPNDPQNLRNFDLYYDAIVHQVVTHETLISIRNDWKTGVYGENAAQIGVINMDIPTSTVKPFEVRLEKGSTWTGFFALFQLGMSHIKEGTDHLLFLLVLLIPAPLLVENRRWSGYIGTRKSLWKLLKIITAFTVGHSVTLLFGTLGWIPFSTKLIESLIAVSILLSAIHAIFPLFFQKETYIAAGFGLIHGLAFSNTLSNMPLTPSQMALSILGFNLGIEAMQLFVMCLILPSLLVICYFSTQNYQYFRIVAAILAIVAASAWLVERVTETPNFIAVFLEKAPEYSWWIVGDLAILAVITWFLNRKTVS